MFSVGGRDSDLESVCPIYVRVRRPLTWEVDGKKYLNERSVGMQQTAWSFVSQMCPGIKKELNRIWFGVDDTDSSVYMPFYTHMTCIPETWANRDNAMMNFTFDSAFYVRLVCVSGSLGLLFSVDVIC